MLRRQEKFEAQCLLTHSFFTVSPREYWIIIEDQVSRSRMIWLRPHPLFLSSSCVSPVELTDRRRVEEMGEEPNHTTTRKPVVVLLNARLKQEVPLQATQTIENFIIWQYDYANSSWLIGLFRWLIYVKIYDTTFFCYDCCK